MHNDDLAGTSCECGHRYEEHRGIAECMIQGCDCSQYHIVNTETIHEHTCEVCGRNYKCGYHRCMEGENDGICNICVKKIEDEYRGDSMVYLFGITGDKPVNGIRAKQLANKILSEGLTVKKLYEFWRNNQ